MPSVVCLPITVYTLQERAQLKPDTAKQAKHQKCLKSPPRQLIIEPVGTYVNYVSYVNRQITYGRARLPLVGQCVFLLPPALDAG